MATSLFLRCNSRILSSSSYNLFQNGRHFKYSFVYLQIFPCCLVLKLEKECFPLNGAARVKFQVSKRILKWRPFWNKVYSLGSFNFRKVSLNLISDSELYFVRCCALRRTGAFPTESKVNLFILNNSVILRRDVLMSHS